MKISELKFHKLNETIFDNLNKREVEVKDGTQS